MNEDFYINLIYKQLDGRSTKDDDKILDSWTIDSSENRSTYDAISLAWEKTETYPQTVAIDLEEEFNILKKRISEPIGKVVEIQKHNKSNSKIWLVAASFGLLIFLAAGIIRPTIFNKKSSEISFKAIEAKSEITLDDGSLIVMKKDAELLYPEKFDSDIRKVKFKGEAFFQIAKDNKPFIIETAHERITVLGTSFGIKALKNENTEVLVKSGKVKLSLTTSEEGVVLEANDLGIADRANKKLSVVHNTSLNNLSWQTNELKFDNAKMTKVISTLESVYDIKVSADQSNIKNCIFSSTFVAQNPEQILSTISDVFGSTLTKSNNYQFLITGGSCD